MCIVLLHYSCFLLFKSWFGNKYLEVKCLDWPTKHTVKHSIGCKRINTAIKCLKSSSCLHLTHLINYFRSKQGRSDALADVNTCETSSPPGGGIYQSNIMDVNSYSNNTGIVCLQIFR